MTTFWHTLAMMWSGAAMVVIGVVLGGVLVYRTKRESHETLFPRAPKTDAGPVNVDDMFQLGDGEEEDPMQDIAREQNARFIQQIISGKETADMTQEVPADE